MAPTPSGQCEGRRQRADHVRTRERIRTPARQRGTFIVFTKKEGAAAGAPEEVMLTAANIASPP